MLHISHHNITLELYLYIVLADQQLTARKYPKNDCG